MKILDSLVLLSAVNLLLVKLLIRECNMPECFVTLDKYKADLSRQMARDKLLLERLEDKLGKCESVEQMALIGEIISLLKQPLDFWFTQQEWSGSLGYVPIGKRQKFESVADGVQESFQF